MSSLMKEKLRGPELTVEDLCKFVRAHFGPASVLIAQQHVDTYRNRGHHDIAATWSSVRDQLKKQDQEIKNVA